MPDSVFKNEREDFVVTFYNAESLELLQNKKTQDEFQDEFQDREIIMEILKFCIKRPLVEKGFLEMTIPDKPTSRYQKYVTKNKD